MKMPIAARLLAGAPLGFMGEALAGVRRTQHLQEPAVITIAPVSPNIQRKVLRSLVASVPFDVQVASQLYWGNKKEFYRIDRDFGPMRLPYPQMWMEWRIPSDGWMEGKRFHEELNTEFAAYIYDDEPEDHRGCRVMTAQLLAHNDTVFTPSDEQVIPVLLNELVIRWAVDHDGVYVPNSLAEYVPDHLDPDIAETLVKEAKSNVFVACMALNLINCRNVTTAKAGVVHQRRSGTMKRRGVEPVRYHTIVLPGMVVERGKGSKRDAAANAEAMRLHCVRGHFKTFTKDAPLLGKHVGTYWWNPGVRGNRKKGQVVQDYRLEGEGA